VQNPVQFGYLALATQIWPVNGRIVVQCHNFRIARDPTAIGGGREEHLLIGPMAAIFSPTTI